jgi:hypothetical protein
MLASTIRVSLLPLLIVGAAAIAEQRPWVDDLNKPSQWSVYGEGNPAKIETSKRGVLKLSLGHVVYGWPYEYQWSGIHRHVALNVRLFPILEATLSQVQPGSYAHLELSVLDRDGHAVKSLRSETLIKPGVITWDLGSQLDPATYEVDLRLIVGGANEGCSVTYDRVGLSPRHITP